MATIVQDTVKIEGLTLSNIIWRKYRRQPVGFIEKVLDLNPGLSASETIPLGTVITFPIEEVTKVVETRKLVRFL